MVTIIVHLRKTVRRSIITTNWLNNNNNNNHNNNNDDDDDDDDNDDDGGDGDGGGGVGDDDGLKRVQTRTMTIYAKAKTISLIGRLFGYVFLI